MSLAKCHTTISYYVVLEPYIYICLIISNFKALMCVIWSVSNKMTFLHLFLICFLKAGSNKLQLCMFQWKEFRWICQRQCSSPGKGTWSLYQIWSVTSYLLSVNMSGTYVYEFYVHVVWLTSKLPSGVYHPRIPGQPCSDHTPEAPPCRSLSHQLRHFFRGLNIRNQRAATISGTTWQIKQLPPG